MRHLLTSFAVFLALAGPVAAQASKPVVELYTSQGCSSCPPADRLLAQLADRGDVIALALHVDYWDYIGWADDLADPAFSDRQRAYARAADASHVYTPQMVVGGRSAIVGSDPAALTDALARLPASPVALVARRVEGNLHVDARAVGAVPETLVVQIVRYTPSLTRDIARGENAGKSITYRNVVTDWRRSDDWITSEPMRRILPLDEGGPVVVILQDGTTGPVLAAVELP